MFYEKKKTRAVKHHAVQKKIPARGFSTEMMVKFLKIIQDSVLGTDYRPHM